jgi:hypothetical protein
MNDGGIIKAIELALHEKKGFASVSEISDLTLKVTGYRRPEEYVKATIERMNVVELNNKYCLLQYKDYNQS